MKHIWNQPSYSDHGMVSLKVNFETIDRNQGIFKCPLSELHLDVNYQSIIKSNRSKMRRKNLWIQLRLKSRKSLCASLGQDPSKVGFEIAEWFWLSEIQNLAQNCLRLKRMSIWQWGYIKRHYMIISCIIIRSNLCYSQRVLS